MKTQYYNKLEDVLFFNPTTKLLVKIFGAKYFVIRCKICNKIPAEIYGNTCLEHILKRK